MIRFLLEKEFKLIRRNIFLPRVIIMMPLIVMLLFPFAVNMEVKNINLSVVDRDQSTQSTRMVHNIGSSNYFHLFDYTGNFKEAYDGIDQGDVDIVLEIPHNFGRDLVSGIKPTEVKISANAVNATKAGMGTYYLMSIMQEYAYEQATLAALAMPAEAMAAIEPPVQVSYQHKFNPQLNYKAFMVPALMVMLLTILCGFLPAMNIVSEKEVGTIEQMNVTPVRKFDFIASKIIPYWIIGYVVVTICFLAAYFVFGLVPVGSYFTIYIALIFFIVAISGLGLIISNYSSTIQQAMFVMFFFLIIMILLSGLFTPIQSMPNWAQNITIFIPLRYFIEIMRGVYLKGCTLVDIWTQLAALGAFSIVLNLWAILSYRKQG